MNKYFSIFFLTIILILIYGIYITYDIFYSNYFDQVNYSDTTFIGTTKIPSKIEIIFSGFKNLKIIIICFFISTILIQTLLKLKKK